MSLNVYLPDADRTLDKLSLCVALKFPVISLLRVGGGVVLNSFSTLATCSASSFREPFSATNCFTSGSTVLSGDGLLGVGDGNVLSRLYCGD